jgi:hypothetical protein
MNDTWSIRPAREDDLAALAVIGGMAPTTRAWAFARWI